jgi:hypothetical protein
MTMAMELLQVNSFIDVPFFNRPVMDAQPFGLQLPWILILWLCLISFYVLEKMKRAGPDEGSNSRRSYPASIACRSRVMTFATYQPGFDRLCKWCLGMQ